MEKKQAKTTVYNVIIMDRSGSMWEIQRSAINGYNEVLGEIKAAKRQYAESQDHRITLVLFDSSAVENVYWNEDPDRAEILTTKTYVPGASTPLYDAIGRTVTRLQSELEGQEDYSVVVTIITDGYENSSTEYSLSSVRALIVHLTAEGWSFAYMGTDHDVKGVTVSLSINNVMKFAKNEEDTRRSFAAEKVARACYSKRLAEFDQACPDASWEDKKMYMASISRNYYEKPHIPGHRITPDKITSLNPGEVFVFGSNEQGQHAGGAARIAYEKFGAEWGKGVGPQGHSYAIPTMQGGVETIKPYVDSFIDFAKGNPENRFLVTRIGCGIAGFTDAEIAPLFKDAIAVDNITLPKEFWDELVK